jgi:hypothetical protein
MRAGFLLWFLAIAIPSKAQFSFGVKGGLNLSDVVINNITDNPDAESDFSMKAGFHGGFFAAAEIGPRTGIIAELLYSNKGVKAINNINLHYISLPVLVRYALADKLIVEGGPELSYLVSATSRYGNVNNIWNNKIDVGVDLGVNYLFSSRLSCGLRFNAGFSSVIKNAGNNSTGEKIRYQNRVLQLSVAYTLKKIDDQPER